MTAVEWLVEQLNIWQTIADEDTNATLDTVRKLIEKALEMEKQQIIDAYQKGFIRELGNRDEDAEQYYSETYKKDK